MSYMRFDVPFQGSMWGVHIQGCRCSDCLWKKRPEPTASSGSPPSVPLGNSGGR